MFLATLFILAKKWKQPKYPSTKEWINNMGGVEKAAGKIVEMDRNTNNMVD